MTGVTPTPPRLAAARGPVRRLVRALVTLAVAVALLFALLAAAPGDPTDLVGDDAGRASLRAEFGYDRSLAARLAGWSAGALQGDLGVSRVVRPGAPVAELLAARWSTSLATLLASTALLGVLGTGSAFAARHGGRWVRAGVHLLSSPPAFLLAFATVTALNEGTWALLSRGLVARPSWFALPDQASPVRWMLGVVVLAVGSGAWSQVHGELEDHLARTARAPWVDAALGRGEPLAGLLLRATAPVLAAVLADRAALLAGGLVVVEKVLLVPGLGATLFDAAAGRDYDVACAAALATTTWVVVIRTAADLARAAIDPRLALASGAGP